ncbi:MAG: hypothetical protein CMP48_10210 [Rickettsiales bacterium]|nr:hypothetical protein [Rickettsiales bacterium]
MVLRLIGHLLLVLTLTILTQIGGVIYVLTYFLSKRLSFNTLKSFMIFLGVYLVVSVAVLPVIAPFFGRKPLPLFGNLRPVNYLTCVLNRHYVVAELDEVLVEMSDDYSEKFGGSVNYLDANFPLFNGFPLMPHLSHNDGKKVDLAFCYDDKSGSMTDHVPSWIGYGAYDEPKEGEQNYPKLCSEKGYWQYGLLKWITFDNRGYKVNSKRTSWIIKRVTLDDRVSKVFIEPHLKARWGLNGNDKVRFHGCQAVRHDDHIHLQIR